ncbi:mechanosensitive ion channel domain-containing protein [Sedimentisphaera salicampi]|uniref:mechanosensitive ion channel domain-containing protein n=1 Tax=Sedimentisphaera salicampi TaxID=1941349 RepID=UPI000B9B2BAE|nr:mechanosensitive ion channel domain-containing protein [Sedimentisphaera salicampi]OXU16191.1 Potassium efflux system KefA precursor [Sedimentisphaera salicampi]
MHKTAYNNSIFIKLLIVAFLLIQGASFAEEKSPAKETQAEAPPEEVKAEPEEAWSVDVKQIEQARQRISENKEMEEEEKSKYLEIYDSILEQAELFKQYQAEKESFSNMQKNAVAELEKVKKELEKLKEESAELSAEDKSASELETRLTEANMNLESARETSTKLENEPKRRAERRTQIPEQRKQIQESIAELNEKLSQLPAESEQDKLIEANRMLLKAKLKAQGAKLDSLAEELKAYEATSEILALRRDLAAAKLSKYEKQVKFWQDALSQARKKEAERAKQEAKKAVQQSQRSHPLVQELANENVELAKQQSELVKDIEQTNSYLKEIQLEVENLSQDFSSLQEQIDKAGKITSAMGVLLMAKKNNLKDVRQHKRQISERVAKTSTIQLKWSQYDRRWADLAETEAQAERLLEENSVSEDMPNYASVKEEAENLLRDRRKIVRKIADYYMDHITALAQLDMSERSLVKTVEKYRSYINKSILWVKSSSPVQKSEIAKIISGVKAFAQNNNPARMLGVIVSDFMKRPHYYIIAGIAFLLLIFSRPKLIKTAKADSQKVQKITEDRFVYTLREVAVMLFCASAIPLAMVFLGWRLLENSANYEYFAYFAEGLFHASYLAFAFGIMRFFTKPCGLGSHFGMNEEALQTFSANLVWFFSILIPAAFLYYSFQLGEDTKAGQDACRRIIFLIQQASVIVFLITVLNPKGTIIRSWLEKHEGSWLDKLKYLLFTIAILVPFSFCILSIIGYGYAAMHLHQELMYTFALLVTVFFLTALLKRSLLVTRRRLAIQQLDRLKEQTIEEAQSDTEQTQSVNMAQQAGNTISTISDQARSVIKFVSTLLVVLGVWWIWKSTLPALEALENIQLSQTTDAQGEIIIISLGSLFKAIVIFIITLVLTRNVPGLLEIMVLQKLPINSAASFAITTLCRYLLFIIGIVYTCFVLGIRWSTVQWLVAAVMVGLGFGLQEIFANFISGLIILFEQPIRVGDTITIGDVSGRVSKIKIRATTIRKWDEKELVVPNKEFITGRLVNWSLSDTTLRIEFPVGVAYGSDVQKAEKTLLDIAKRHPDVIDTKPAPRVIFKGFGSSSLDLELRVYISSINQYLDVWHQINSRIDKRFREEKIEIAFPQTDLHFRSSDLPIPLDIKGSERKSSEAD